MKPNLLKDRLSTVSVLEKETEKPKKNAEIEKAPMTSVSKPEVAQVSEPLQTVKEAPKPKVAHKSLFAPVIEEEELVKENVSQTIEQEEVQQQTISDEAFDESFTAFKPKTKPKKKEWKFRLKVVTAVYIIVLGVAIGWVTANTVRISNTTRAIHASDIQYVQKIKELEKLKERQAEKENKGVLSLEDLLEVTPLPLDDITDYEKRTNWFDNIVNWFGNLFGG